MVGKRCRVGTEGSRSFLGFGAALVQMRASARVELGQEHV